VTQIEDPAVSETSPPEPAIQRRAVVPLPRAKATFASFSHRNFRLWFTGQAASLVGTWMQITAQGFLVFQLTQSPAYLGYVGFAAGVPIWLFTLFGGVISDRMPRRTLLVITQTTMMVLAFILAALSFLGLVQAWHIILLAFGVGVANAFDAPARISFVVELVEREDLGNAVALNSTMFNLGSATGPAVAGVVYAWLGPAWCFTLNGLSFIAVITALLMMRLQPQPLRVRAGSAFDDLKEGLHYVITTPLIRVLIAIPMVLTVFGMTYNTLLPAWAVDILRGDSTTNGFLQSARGVGSLCAALMIASMGRVQMRGKVLTVGSLVFPLALVVWAALRWVPLSLAALAGVGWAWMLIINMVNILLQSLARDDLRGRVMSIYSLSFFGMMPVGALVTGVTAEAIGAPITVVVGAVFTFVFAAYLWLRVPQLRALE
jgi:predicted MFS family arabinose efflux permease